MVNMTRKEAAEAIKEIWWSCIEGNEREVLLADFAQAHDVAIVELKDC